MQIALASQAKSEDIKPIYTEMGEHFSVLAICGSGGGCGSQQTYIIAFDFDFISGVIHCKWAAVSGLVKGWKFNIIFLAANNRWISFV